MSIRGSNFPNQHPFASDHALVWQRCMPDGLLYGCDMSFTASAFTIGTGFMLVAGRMFEITAAESLSVSPGSGYARVYAAIDTGGTATENSFDQVSFGVDYAASIYSFADLTQQEININQGAAVYQTTVAILSINNSGIVSIEQQMGLVSPGAGTGAFAVIAVIYPAGSIVTVTDGNITYSAPNTSGTALFIIPYAATWTVTATDGTDTASETVGITTEGQIMSVELLYKKFLFKDGQINTELTGGINGTVQNDVIYFSKEISVGNNKTFTTREKIDLTKAKSIMARMVSPNTVAALYFRLLVGDNEKNGENVTTSYLVAYEGVTSPFNSEEKIVSLDVSSLSGEYYLGYAWGVSTSASDSRTVTGRIYEWWLQ